MLIGRKRDPHLFARGPALADSAAQIGLGRRDNTRPKELGLDRVSAGGDSVNDCCWLHELTHDT